MWGRVALRAAGIVIVFVIWIVGIPSALIQWTKWKGKQQ